MRITFFLVVFLLTFSFDTPEYQTILTEECEFKEENYYDHENACIVSIGQDPRYINLNWYLDKDVLQEGEEARLFELFLKVKGENITALEVAYLDFDLEARSFSMAHRRMEKVLSYMQHMIPDVKVDAYLHQAIYKTGPEWSNTRENRHRRTLSIRRIE